MVFWRRLLVFAVETRACAGMAAVAMRPSVRVIGAAPVDGGPAAETVRFESPPLEPILLSPTLTLDEKLAEIRAFYVRLSSR